MGKNARRLPASFLNDHRDVQFVPVDIVKDKYSIVKMIVPTMGDTDKHPKSFYVKGI